MTSFQGSIALAPGVVNFDGSDSFACGVPVTLIVPSSRQGPTGGTNRWQSTCPWMSMMKRSRSRRWSEALSDMNTVSGPSRTSIERSFAFEDTLPTIV